MKRALSLILALVLCLSLCACGSGGKETTPPETTVPETTVSSKEKLTSLLISEKWKDTETGGDRIFLESGNGKWGEQSITWELSGNILMITCNGGLFPWSRMYTFNEEHGVFVWDDGGLLIPDSRYSEMKMNPVISDFGATFVEITDNQGNKQYKTYYELETLEEKDENSFDRQYEGAKITIIGVIDEIKPEDAYGYSSITVIYGVINIAGWEIEAGSSAIRSLQVGDTVKITGTINGFNGPKIYNWSNWVGFDDDDIPKVELIKKAE